MYVQSGAESNELKAEINEQRIVIRQRHSNNAIHVSPALHSLVCCDSLQNNEFELFSGWKFKVANLVLKHMSSTTRWNSFHHQSQSKHW